MTDSSLAMLPVLLPLFGAAAALSAKVTHRPGVSEALGTAGAIIGFVAPWPVLALLLPVALAGGISFQVGDWHRILGISMSFDGLAWLMDVLVFTGSGVAWLYSRGRNAGKPLFTALMLIQTSSLAAAASTSDIFNLFVSLEVMGMTSYVLIAESGKPGAFVSALQYLLYSSAAMMFFLLGVFGLYRLTGSLSYDGIAAGLLRLGQPVEAGTAILTVGQAGAGASSRVVADLSVAAIMLAMALRFAVIPVHGWLPGAHAMAPHAVSAVLSGVLLKSPLFALGRFLMALPDNGQALRILSAAGAVSAFTAVLLALVQKDAKRLLAWHSISQMGYIVAAMGTGTVDGMTAAWLHAFNHALFKGLLFLSVGTMTDAAGTRNVYELRGAGRRLAASGDRFRLTAILYVAGALSIMAIPPTGGFISKNVLTGMFHDGWMYWLLTLAGAGTVASFGKLSMILLPPHRAARGNIPSVTVSTMEPPADDGPIAGPPATITFAMKTAMGLFAVGCAGMGLWGRHMAGLAGRLLRAASGGGESALSVPAPFDVYHLRKTAVVVVAGAILTMLVMSAPGKKLAGFARSIHGGPVAMMLAFLGALVAAGQLISM